MSVRGRRPTRRSPLPGYKACRNCKAVVPDEAEKCPVCGGTDFTKDWMGLVIILKPEESCIAKKLGINRAGMYAIEVL
ncbi:MAG: DNA-directed RNA polymerase, subunit E'' [Vulcanisaeta sp.]|nr:DNA-directed RNA polymerase, subunit E'' [Vulcanisaeta sp.]MCG2870073.1 DNA-directed RNA polymerase, subunit E'' [Vulcanisaeta sp.]MCG2880019.1 DNA-directed RNA polymerase, subunit E'' [Vulcanisaeta sp.]MCG2886701.1 DNA-directed RNA polymerase, subunit E'' [Vulcanisaeta sp.]MCG2892299.1 DNA-directed RNA polymerase, subunit E'' [Vulcanisaeta sp.]